MSRLEEGVLAALLPAPVASLEHRAGKVSESTSAVTASATLHDSSNDCAAEECVHQARRHQSLSEQHSQLANSLQLSVEEQEAFLYIPSSVLVACYGKPWDWCCLSYIYQRIANRYAGVMRGYIAIAGMELRALELRAPRRGPSDVGLERLQRLEALAQSNYHSALKELSTLLADACTSTWNEDNTDALFTMWFLILRYEMHDKACIGTSICHLRGIRSLLEIYSREDDNSRNKELPWVSQNMLLLIL